MNVLEGITAHPYLQGRLVLKGGTALNLFVFDLPRLSVDIDLNYVGMRDREGMITERPLIEKGLEAVFQRENLAMRSNAASFLVLTKSQAAHFSFLIKIRNFAQNRTPGFPPIRRDQTRLHFSS